MFYCLLISIISAIYTPTLRQLMCQSFQSNCSFGNAYTVCSSYNEKVKQKCEIKDKTWRCDLSTVCRELTQQRVDLPFLISNTAM